MDKTELAKMMLEWEDVQSHADHLLLQIKDAVLVLGETQQAGNVRATYNGGRKSYDYEEVGSDAPVELVEKHTVVSSRVNWRKLVDEMGIPKNIIPFTEGKPSVTMKFV